MHEWTSDNVFCFQHVQGEEVSAVAFFLFI